MANSVTHGLLPYPIYNARFTALVPYLDADGDPVDPTTPDTEVSKDGGAYADAAEEVTTITGSNGSGYITFSGAETACGMLMVAYKVASGPKATLATLYPRKLPILESGTASAGASTSITLAAGTYTASNLQGLIVRTTGGTGGGGTGGANNQARTIISYNTSTRVATVDTWETTPDNTTTYDLLLPTGANVPELYVTQSEITGVPPASASLVDMLRYVYSFGFRNKITVTSTKRTYFDDGDAAEFEKDLTDDGTTFTESEANTI